MTMVSPGRLALDVLDHAAAVRADYIAQGITHAEFRAFALPELLEAIDCDQGPLTRRVVAASPARMPGPTGSMSARPRSAPMARARRRRLVRMEEGYPPKGLADIFREVQGVQPRPSGSGAGHPRPCRRVLHRQEPRERHPVGAGRRPSSAPTASATPSRSVSTPRCLGRTPALSRVAERRDQIAYDLTHLDGLLAAGVPGVLAVATTPGARGSPTRRLKVQTVTYAVLITLDSVDVFGAIYVATRGG